MPSAFKPPEHMRAVLETADAHIAEGSIVHFKFTCAWCGARQTFEEPNTLYSKGACEECKKVTDLMDSAAQVNYLLIVVSKRTDP